MVNGLYSSANAMNLALRKQEISTNNLANAQTTGFKVSRLATLATVDGRRDGETYMRQREVQHADEVRTDWSDGPLVPTGNPLDVALRGDGFFAVSTPKGERYVRSTSLRTMGDGLLVDPSGSPILDQGGQQIRIQGTKTTVSAQGKISSDGQEVATLRIVDFPRPYTLRQEGDGHWAPYPESADAKPPAPQPVDGDTHVEQGVLEGPNVNTVAEMVRMIAQFRDYEAEGKVLHAVDTTLDKAVNQIGRV
jgi:flagellar basal-body rod protein FlgG